jgi:hypothetical protein
VQVETYFLREKEQMSSYKPIRQYEQHTENPFVEDAVTNVQIKKRKQMVLPTKQTAHYVHQVIDTDTGEVQDVHTAFVRAVEVDETRFVKLYLQGLKDIWDLSKPAIRVFTYVIDCMRIGEDTIIFDVEECMEYTGYKSDRSVFIGLATLIENGLIARSTKAYRYFINPMIVFNGNRVTFAKTYIKKRKQEKDPNQLTLFDEQEQLPTPEGSDSGEQSSG